MATALRVLDERRHDEVARVRALRDRLVAGLCARVPDCRLHGDPDRQVAGTVHDGIPGTEAEALLELLDRAGIAAAAGSSCTSGATEPSHVLAAMGLTRADALASIRLTLGHPSTDADVDAALTAVPAAVEQLRAARRVPA
jgi:cysteine desulfurase